MNGNTLGDISFSLILDWKLKICDSGNIEGLNLLSRSETRIENQWRLKYAIHLHQVKLVRFWNSKYQFNDSASTNCVANYFDKII